MLRLQDIRKKYVTGGLVQSALDGVTLNLRSSEFVAILGPSGSGKTTLLNVIGGLDRYDSGDLIINGVSTKRYTDRDWDSYRSHTIGFVFQSYNLIPHQSVLANVELALTISGVKRSERRARAKRALEQVGLGDQLHKRPSQMSGGQMQRVAIARALVNDPDILLADEPTGALDTDTSLQVMELLREVARDRLVVMVTHNPELAEQYATRIVRLRDGRITDDTDPAEPEEDVQTAPVHRNMGHASMPFHAALALSMSNLRTKMARTLLTAFAGSIGIIGIALILSLSTGVNTYITDIQKDTMTSYPITIDAQSLDFTTLITSAQNTASAAQGEAEHPLDGVYSDPSELELAGTMATSLTENNLTAFKQYLEQEDCPITPYLGENGIVYSYDAKFSVYTHDSEGTLVNTDGSTLQSGEDGMQSMMTDGAGCMTELLCGPDGLVSEPEQARYELLYGSWPQSADEVVLIVNRHSEISQTMLYRLGILPTQEYREIMTKLRRGEELTIETQKWSYEDICSREFFLLPACSTYTENPDGTFSAVTDTRGIEELLGSAMKLTVSGIICPADEDDTMQTAAVLGYTKALTDRVIDATQNSAVVRAQEEHPDTNVLSGMRFAPADDAQKIADAKVYLEGLDDTEKAALAQELLGAAGVQDSMPAGESSAMSDAYLSAAGDEAYLAIYERFVSPGSYEDNLSAFGVVSYDAPSSISLYADSFEDKDAISDCIDAYNDTAAEEDQIHYTDYVGLLMSSVTTIINVVTYVLVAFVAVSLVVSSIMIGIITYISVLERTREIGILRALGASKRNISQVFNAETFIIGLFSGGIGIALTMLLLIPGNAVIHALTGTASVNAALPAASAVRLIILSVILTLLGGLIPSRKAAKRDPVAALRSE